MIRIRNSYRPGRFVATTDTGIGLALLLLSYFDGLGLRVETGAGRV